MLSILIPTYNYDVTNLVTEIHKQCNETAISFEIIVSDDASSNTALVLKNKSINKLEHSNYIINTVNRGRSANRDFLAKKATFNWLLFLDSDVMPVENNFIENYITEIKKNKFIISCGGVKYKREKPKKSFLLRYKYGIKREESNLHQRNEKNHIIVSANILIEKDAFFSLNTLLHNFYGDDLVISENIKNKKIRVNHILNPVFHLGLETSTAFIDKSLQSVKNTVKLEKQGVLTNELRPLQKSYLKLKKYGMLSIFFKLIGLLKSIIVFNLNSSNPSLFWFDMYRLHYYIKLKKMTNA